jgi:hypothetical protein
MQKSADDGNNFDEAGAGNQRTGPVIGGADNVQKTTYVTGQGTDPSAQDTGNPIAQVPSGSGINVGAWIIGAVAVVIALIYGFGILR